MADSLLRVQDLHARYGESKALHGVSFHVEQGEVVTLLGRNGAGKTTALRSLMGILPERSGSVCFEGTETIGLASNKIAKLGMGYVPEERGIFASLNVMENLLLPPVVRRGAMSLDEVFELFPNIYERRDSAGTSLSGGEQQMLAMARILRTGAHCLLLDEPTEGLAPVIVQRIAEVINVLKQRGTTILLVEQNFRFASTVADRHYVVEDGYVVEGISNAEVLRDPAKIEGYLGIEVSGQKVEHAHG